MKPFKEKTLKVEVAGPTSIRNPWGGESAANGLTPRKLVTLLQQAADGDHVAYLSLAEGMEERDPHYSSVLRTRKLAVSSLPVNVVPGDDTEAAHRLADEVRHLVNSPQFGDLIDGLLDALGKGYAVCEIMWDRSTPWRPSQYLWRDPRYFVCDRDRPDIVRLIDEANPAQGIELPPYKFAVHTPRLKSGIMLRGGLARLVAFSYLCKAYAVKDWLGFLEIYGIPLRIGRYGQSANEQDLDVLRTAVSNIGSDAAAILPEGMQIEFEQIAQAAGASELFARLVEWVDRQVSKAVLGQTATTEGTPGKLGNENAQEEVRQDLIAADAKQLANTINRDLIRPFIDLNFGPQDAYPRIAITIPEEEDLVALAENLEKLVPLGLKVSASEVREKLGLSEPAKDADILAPAAATAPLETSANSLASTHCKCGGCAQRALNAVSSENAVDEITALALDGWQEIADTLTDPVLKAIQSAESYDEIAAVLPGLLKNMNEETLRDSLAKAGLMGFGAGTKDLE